MSNRTTLTGADKNRNDASCRESIAHLHHEGLMDMKPILNRGIGKRLRGDEMSRDESYQVEQNRTVQLSQKFLGCTFSREVRTMAWNRMGLNRTAITSDKLRSIVQNGTELICAEWHL